MARVGLTSCYESQEWPRCWFSRCWIWTPASNRGLINPTINEARPSHAGFENSGRYPSNRRCIWRQSVHGKSPTQKVASDGEPGCLRQGSVPASFAPAPSGILLHVEPTCCTRMVWWLAADQQTPCDLLPLHFFSFGPPYLGRDDHVPPARCYNYGCLCQTLARS